MVTRVPNITVGQSPPAAPDVGDLWWSTVSGIEFIWYEDDNGTSQWVTTQPGNAGGRPTSAVKIIAGATAVEDADVGSLLYNNDGVLGAPADLTYDVAAGGGLRLTQTWNNALTTFVPLRISVTATAYDAGSKIFDMLVGGSSKLSLSVVGALSAQWLSAAHDVSAGEVVFARTSSALSGLGTQALGISTTPLFGVYYGDGVPTAVAPRGSLYLNAAGTPYYNNDGATDWVVLGSSADQIIVGATNISGGTNGWVLYDDNGVLGEYSLLPETVGGTGISTYATGDLIYASAPDSLSTLPAGTDTYLLTMAAGVPTWAAAPATGVTSLSFGTTGLTPSSPTTGAVVAAGTLVAANGGTSFSTYATGDLIYASAIDTLSKLAASTNGFVLTLVGGLPEWAASTGGVTSWSGGTTGLTPNTATTGGVVLAGTLAVGNGGTGAGAFTAGSVVFAGAAGVYSQDNANLFWDDANNRLGIGDATPSYTVDVAGDGRFTLELTGKQVVASNGIFVNALTIADDYTIAVGYSGVSAGPVTIAAGKSVTISAGSRWVVL